MMLSSSPLQGLENHAYDVNLFVESWIKLWQQVSCLPRFHSDLANRIFVDVMNEPDSMNIMWEPSNGRPGAHQLYLGTADALWRMTPNKMLFMFEGRVCGGSYQQLNCLPLLCSSYSKLPTKRLKLSVNLCAAR